MIKKIWYMQRKIYFLNTNKRLFKQSKTYFLNANKRLFKRITY